MGTRGPRGAGGIYSFESARNRFRLTAALDNSWSTFCLAGLFATGACCVTIVHGLGAARRASQVYLAPVGRPFGYVGVPGASLGAVAIGNLFPSKQNI